MTIMMESEFALIAKNGQMSMMMRKKILSKKPDIKTKCLKCGKVIEVKFDDEGEPLDDIICSNFNFSELFNTTTVPLDGGFMHAFCQYNIYNI